MRFIKKNTLLLLTLVLFASCKEKTIYQNDSYKWYSNRIEQSEYTAIAESPYKIRSNYKSPIDLNQSPQLTFKFAINGKDNELFPNVNHTFVVKQGQENTPIITFGSQYVDTVITGTLPQSCAITFRCDMNEMLKAFEKDGFYVTPTGAKIYREDFKGVYIAGQPSPLMWDFDNLYTHDELLLKDPDGDGIYETTLIFNEPKEQKELIWEVKNDLTPYPHYTAPMLLENAVYNMALDEMINAIEPDSTLRTGKEWAGVWTRDVSYSIILSMAHLQPEVSKISLMKKVDSKGRIIQDTGTGGAWPISSDRLIWATAAMEIYRVTGDTAWLNQVYPIIKRSLEDDAQTIFDPTTGLILGESSFIDWREQSYPRWMQPADIYQSRCLGTNVLYYNALNVACEMATLLKKPNQAKLYSEKAEQLKNQINHYFWLPFRGYYGMYLYGRTNPMILEKSETLGESLAILFDVATQEQALQITEKMPLVDYGATIFFPQIGDMPPYHNNAIWPFVSSYWALANAKVGNEEGTLFGIGSIYRAAALFTTNKENFVAENGDHRGTQINSDNMLWSLSGNISLVHKLLFGMNFENDGLRFAPFVPKAMEGNRRLENFKYRKAILDITLDGYGNQIAEFKIDGKESEPYLPGNISGKHQIEIILKNEATEGHAINLVKNRATPLQPRTTLKGDTLLWSPIEGAILYGIYYNGKLWNSIDSCYIILPDTLSGELQVSAWGQEYGSFASEPIRYRTSEQKIEVEKNGNKSTIFSTGYSGSGYLEIDHHKPQTHKITVPIEIAENGEYLIDWRYANGNGPINTENKCAIRTMKIDGEPVGAVVFPHRGTNEWSNWGWSNVIRVKLSAGKHLLELTYEPHNDNMNLETNQALLDYVRITAL